MIDSSEYSVVDASFSPEACRAIESCFNFFSDLNLSHVTGKDKANLIIV